MKIMKKNSSGSNVTDLQRRLKLLSYDLGVTSVDGIFGERTGDAVKKFQQDRSLLVSGIVDQETWQELVDASHKIGDRLLYLKNPPFRGDDVRTLQLWLKTLGFYPYNENGIFCERTLRALVEFQDNMNIEDDGIAGERTLNHLMGLKRIITSKKTSNFPYINNRNRRNPGIKNSIMLDCNPGPEDLDSRDNSEDAESLNDRIYICSNIIGFCREMLTECGYRVQTSFGDSKNRETLLFDRIANANSSGADYLISINLNHSSDRGANGCSCYYFRGLKSYSIGGFQLANEIQDQLVSGLGILDCRVHGANYAILKNTEMISVVVEPAFISNKKQRKEIENTGYQRKMSEKIAGAIKTYLED
ncbi:MAG: peptidoglycan-binding protein [Actinomycetia bacterium]|nr:peptidoglycan-binding protein [Actinomycetes bacterium]